MKQTQRFAASAACALLVSMAAAPARAEEPKPPDLVALGKQEFEIGQKEFNLGRYESSIEHFEASYRLTGRAALLFNIGYTYRHLFQRTRKLELLELAIERFKAFLASVPESDPPSRTARERTQAELKGAEAELAAEQAARAKGEENLAVGETALARGNLGDAHAQIERFLAAPNNERSGLARAWMLDGRVALAEGKVAKAQASFVAALSLDRSLQPPPGAPDAVKAIYKRALEQLGSAPPLTVLHSPPGSLKAGLPVELGFSTLSDPARLIVGQKLFYRAGAGAFSSLPVQKVGKVTLPPVFTAALLPGARVEYYGVVVDEHGAVLEYLGSPQLPFAVMVEKPKAPNVAKRPWFWAVMGVTAAAVGAGIGLAVHYTQPPTYDVPAQVSGLRLSR